MTTDCRSCCEGCEAGAEQVITPFSCSMRSMSAYLLFHPALRREKVRVLAPQNVRTSFGLSVALACCRSPDLHVKKKAVP